MLNPFPIQFLALAAYFILRLFMSITLFWLGWHHLKNRRLFQHPNTEPEPSRRTTYLPWILIAAEFIIATFILLGAFTQFAALGLIAYIVFFLIIHRRLPDIVKPSRLFFVLLLGCAFTLFITGAGAFAFDLPI